MAHRHEKSFYPIAPEKSKAWQALHQHIEHHPAEQSSKPKLEIVLKCDSAGSVEAVSASILKAAPAEVDVHIISSGVGDIHKSDILIAETGSRLVVGFQVCVPPGVDRELKEHAVEARLHEVIYHLTEDIRNIAESLITRTAPEENIIGSAKVIALFKSSRKGVIIGCEVMSGHLAVGQHFRVISATGPVYTGSIESMHIEDKTVQKAVAGQKAGIKISDFHNAKIGDLVESFKPSPAKRPSAWRPVGGVLRK
ncbi:MAG: hypothetical protein C4538_02220 [Nitrospiraceae bacterium]|nr:MAG: hypothetical protein C4538_02220 [Nitrospiraceae bacterium]